MCLNKQININKCTCIYTNIGTLKKRDSLYKLKLPQAWYIYNICDNLLKIK